MYSIVPMRQLEHFTGVLRLNSTDFAGRSYPQSRQRANVGPGAGFFRIMGRNRVAGRAGGMWPARGARNVATMMGTADLACCKVGRRFFCPEFQQ
jgi:hypothetical protein